jgi:hypothetical protein
MMGKPYRLEDDRHRCAGSDQQYEDGEAVIFFAWSEDDVWVLCIPDDDAWHDWFERPSPETFPLQSRQVLGYGSYTAIEFCPYCGMPLAEDPAFLERLRDMGRRPVPVVR